VVFFLCGQASRGFDRVCESYLVLAGFECVGTLHKVLSYWYQTTTVQYVSSLDFSLCRLDEAEQIFLTMMTDRSPLGRFYSPAYVRSTVVFDYCRFKV